MNEKTLRAKIERIQQIHDILWYLPHAATTGT